MRYPKFEPTPQQKRAVEELVRARIPQVKIAEQLGIARSTLRRYFPDELKILEHSVGRPQWSPTESERQDITILAAAGFKQDSIARRYNISVDTLQYCCSEELANGYDLRKQDAIIALYRKGVGEDAAPNAAALDKFLKRIDVLPQPVHRAASRTLPPGKKEQALADAKTAEQGTSWSDILSDKSARN